jgi:hypothetical protein
MTEEQARVVQESIQRISTLVPPEVDVKEYLRTILDTQMAPIFCERPMGVVPTRLVPSANAYASARFTVELLDEPERILDRPEGIVDLGVIEWLLRPALPISDGLINCPASPPWNFLPEHIVESASKSVCRLDLVHGTQGPWQLGTGFIIGESADGILTVMTNAHVVQEALRLGWPAIEDLDLVCDFERYSTEFGGKLFKLTRQHTRHQRYDLALLFLNRDAQDLTKSLIPLRASASSPNPIESIQIGVIGHPSFNSVYDPFPKYFGFDDSFGVKRFSPGQIRKFERRLWGEHEVDLFLHDATTLSGSSGSCILDLKSMRVVGLHFGGWPIVGRRISTSRGDVVAELFESNGAVPLWLLSDDPALKSVRFE